MIEQPGRRDGESGDDPLFADSSAAGASPRPSGKRGSRGADGSAQLEQGSGVKVAKRENIFAVIFRFIGEVISELRKVIWPGKKQMITYTIVVFIFLFVMVSLIFGLDQIFSRGVLWLYG
ncbi:preprotein translocase subunit SecE [Hoyosella rhizosphaerae]|uniref:Protein translocase subunit SecE n=1 Tax=Hoyosella rhizosphaerae TaxID=1755582 RepID=A0A916UKE6_9ACTN|nr:preprotein translocase subunit SecE [Hoyosella rhizosphaerae]MBN4925253.1 preprotein translocase subunit SecE [Hoyosella rhizosphaerae]GGC76728.1 protein translocase subunit SecE [Hoyosella rhizosphaerae]